jgi:hypothetical protein
MVECAIREPNKDCCTAGGAKSHARHFGGKAPVKLSYEWRSIQCICILRLIHMSCYCLCW